MRGKGARLFPVGPAPATWALTWQGAAVAPSPPAVGRAWHCTWGRCAPGLRTRRALSLGGGVGGDTAAILLGLKLYNSFPFLHRYITLLGGSHHLYQPGWLEQM